MSRQIRIYEAQLSAQIIANWAELNASNAHTLGRYSAQLAETADQAITAVRSLQQQVHASPYTFTDMLSASYSALRNYSVLATGFDIAGLVQSNESLVVPAFPP